MTARRWAPRVLATCVAGALALSLVPSAAAEPGENTVTRVSDLRDAELSGLERATVASAGAAGGTASIARAVARGGTQLPAKPRNDTIVDVPVNTADASIGMNLIPYHEFAPRLRALQASDRINVEIIGQSVQGRDLHMVVVTSKMSDSDWASWQKLSDLRTSDPAKAVATFEAGGYDAWKKPLFINNNIHGNEWEGTDAAFRLLDELAFSTDADVVKFLDEHIVSVVISNNPDGRVAATRANSNSFDMNRDYITQSQPEVRAVRDQIIRYDPLTFIDLHGYVSGTLIEPTTGPHGENYEYDLYIRNALRNALSMEARVKADVGSDLPNWTGPDTKLDIPFRERLSGWDDWPPIFTPMYAMLHGSIGHTIEFPLNPRGTNLTVTERHRRTDINTRIALATMHGNIDWVTESGDSLLADQLELFRRGQAGESSRPIDDPLALELGRSGVSGGRQVDNRQTILRDFPRAYVIPAGDAQRSKTATSRLVQFLVDNDVEVKVAKTPVTLGGKRYAAGTYVVDMHQAKRGLANTFLDHGSDVTDLFPTMYDISAWSHGDLWGATVEKMESGALQSNQLVDVRTPAPTGSFPEGKRAGYVFSVDSPTGVQAVNRLAGEGVTVGRLADGRFVVSGDAAKVKAVSQQMGIEFSVASAAQVLAATPYSGKRIAVAATFDEVFSLLRMGFDVTNVTHTGFNNGTYSFDDFDALWVSNTAFNPQSLNTAQAEAFSAWLAAGHNVAGRGTSAATFSTRAGLLPITMASVSSSSNGTVRVVNDPTSPITGNALDISFVDVPRPITSFPEGARVDQRLEDGYFMVAGHWAGSQTHSGRPVVVSGTSRGANVTWFGTEPMYRGHPDGLFTQVVNALWW